MLFLIIYVFIRMPDQARDFRLGQLRCGVLTDFATGLTKTDMGGSAQQNLVRSASIRGFKELVTAAGHDPLEFVRASGLPPECLSEDELKIPMAAVIRMLASTARHTRIDDLGLRIATQRSFATIGPLGLLMREQPTIRDVIKVLVDYIWMQVEGLNLSTDEQDGTFVLAAEIPGHRGSNQRQTIELIIGVITGAIRRFVGRAWCPEMVTFRHRRPESVKLHEEFFGKVPLFAQDQNAIVLATHTLQIEVPHADPTAAKHIARYMEMISGTRNQDFKDKVRQLIAAAVPQELSQMDRIAQQLDMHPRTLHRRLTSEGTTFNQLLNEVRLEMMQTHLDVGEKSLTEISELLGFSSLSAFSRWKRKATAPG